MHLVNVALLTVARKTKMTEELICSVLCHYTPVSPETAIIGACMFGLWTYVTVYVYWDRV